MSGIYFLELLRSLSVIHSPCGQKQPIKRLRIFRQSVIGASDGGFSPGLPGAEADGDAVDLCVMGLLVLGGVLALWLVTAL